MWIRGTQYTACPNTEGRHTTAFQYLLYQLSIKSECSDLSKKVAYLLSLKRFFQLFHLLSDVPVGAFTILRFHNLWRRLFQCT